MGQLSQLVSMFEKAQGAKHQPGKPGVRTNARAPATPGAVRGTSGVLGSRTFQSRNSQAGQNKELEALRSPIFAAYMDQMHSRTPMLTYLQGRTG
jgi:hypothetical protein